MRLCIVAVAAVAAPATDWVGRARLRSVDSIDCLERLQRDPQDSCAPKRKRVVEEPARTGAQAGDAWSTGNFPKPLVPELQGGSARCGSHKELLCDPDNVMTESDQKKVALSLQMFRENSMVPCKLPWLRSQATAGPSSPRAEDEHQFRVGVAIMKSLPPSSLDERSLEVFGDYLLSTWEVSPDDCSAGAVLIVVANAQKSWIVAPSCEYVCGGDLETGGRVLNVLETSLGWRAMSKGKELESADFRNAIQNALHELEDVMHEQRGMAFANGHAVVMPDPDRMWRFRKEREWADVAPWAEGLTIVLVLALFGYMAHWYTVSFYGEYLADMRLAFKSLQNTG